MFNPKRERRTRHFGERRGRGSALSVRAPDQARTIQRVRIAQTDQVKVRSADQVQVQTFGTNRQDRPAGTGRSSGRGGRRHSPDSSPLAKIIKTMVALMILFITLVIILAIFWMRAGEAEAEAERVTRSRSTSSAHQRHLEQQRARAKAMTTMQLQQLTDRIEPLGRVRFDDRNSRRTALATLKAQVHQTRVELPHYTVFQKQVDQMVDAYLQDGDNRRLLEQMARLERMLGRKPFVSDFRYRMLRTSLQRIFSAWRRSTR